jgi:3-keto-disaccharide hydrolase
MRRRLAILLAFMNTLSFQSSFAQPEAAPIEGRWDLSYNQNGSDHPSWLEVRHSGNRYFVGQFVGAGGSARPISQVFVEGESFHFAIPPQWEQATDDFKMEGTCSGDQMSGTMTMPDGKSYSFTGQRAPSLKRTKPVVWDKPVTLFNGKDLSGWQPLGEHNQWVVENGVLKSPHSGVNLRTTKEFTDFKLHVEFRYPKESNSGVYLRGRYEVQVEDSRGEAWLGGLGAIYGFLKPYEMVAKGPDQWQSYDITLVGRMVTIVANGKLIINNQEIPGITGGALDSKEGEPGPIYFQGDHGPIEYRNIVIIPAK